MDSPPLGLAQSPPPTRRNLHCWSNLPQDILQLVFERLSFSDFQRAKSVCSSWQSGSRLSLPNNQIPWMILFPDGQNHCLLFNPEDQEKLYKTQDLGDDFANSFCMATHRSWLLMLDLQDQDYDQGNIQEYNLYLLHLLTRARISLPTLVSEFQPNAPVFWIDEKTKDYLVIIKMFDVEFTVYFKKGDNSWKKIHQLPLLGDEEPSNLLYKDHKLYCLRNIKLEVYDFSGDIPLLVLELSIHGCIQRASSDFNMGILYTLLKTNVVVTVSGDVLIVESTRLIKSKIWKFRDYKMVSSKGNYKWEEIVSLGDEAILLDLGITVLAKDIQGVKKNSIYFSGDDFQDPYDENYIFIFNLDTQKVVQPLQFVSSSISLSKACWFLPSFKP